jgi:hypothetical protein
MIGNLNRIFTIENSIAFEDDVSLIKFLDATSIGY